MSTETTTPTRHDVQVTIDLSVWADAIDAAELADNIVNRAGSIVADADDNGVVGSWSAAGGIVTPPAPAEPTTPTLSDADALDRLAAFMARPGGWNGGDVCEEAADLIGRTGRPHPGDWPTPLPGTQDVDPDEAPAAYLAALATRRGAPHDLTAALARLADSAAVWQEGAMHLGCSEVDAVATVLAFAGHRDTASTLLIDHAVDDEGAEDWPESEREPHWHLRPFHDHRSTPAQRRTAHAAAVEYVAALVTA